MPDEAGGGGGNKGPRFKIAVAPGDANDAWRILTDNHLPRHKDNGYAEVFATAGLIPTASEEKAKMMQAIEGEISTPSSRWTASSTRGCMSSFPKSRC